MIWISGGTCAVAAGRKKGELASLGQYVYSVGEGELYGEHPLSLSDVTLKAVPYAYWNNRGMGEMSVWIKELVN